MGGVRVAGALEYLYSGWDFVPYLGAGSHGGAVEQKRRSGNGMLPRMVSSEARRVLMRTAKAWGRLSTGEQAGYWGVGRRRRGCWARPLHFHKRGQVCKGIENEMDRHCSACAQTAARPGCSTQIRCSGRGEGARAVVHR
ncbi:hypothetical protein K438DRAFT_1840080, partial [Mycena galopus ATCC 62051]